MISVRVDIFLDRGSSWILPLPGTASCNSAKEHPVLVWLGCVSSCPQRLFDPRKLHFRTGRSNALDAVRALIWFVRFSQFFAPRLLTRLSEAGFVLTQQLTFGGDLCRRFSLVRPGLQRI